MKKDRQCGMNPYPVYPPYQGMPVGMNPSMPVGMNPGMPGMGMQQPGMGMPPQGMGMGMPTTEVNVGMPTDTGSLEQQVSMMSRQLNALERRVAQLESVMGQTSNYGNTGYNTSSYQML